MAGLEIPILAVAGGAAMVFLDRYSSPFSSPSAATKTVFEELLVTVTEYVTVGSTAAATTASSSVSAASSTSTPLATTSATALPSGCPTFLAGLVPKAIFFTNVLCWIIFVIFLLLVIAVLIMAPLFLYYGMKDDWGSCTSTHEDLQRYFPSPSPSSTNLKAKAVVEKVPGAGKRQDGLAYEHKQMIRFQKGIEAARKANQRIEGVLRRRVQPAERARASKMAEQDTLRSEEVARQSLIDVGSWTEQAEGELAVSARVASAWSESSEEWEDLAGELNR